MIYCGSSPCFSSWMTIATLHLFPFARAKIIIALKKSEGERDTCIFLYIVIHFFFCYLPKKILLIAHFVFSSGDSASVGIYYSTIMWEGVLRNIISRFCHGNFILFAKKILAWVEVINKRYFNNALMSLDGNNEI